MSGYDYAYSDPTSIVSLLMIDTIAKDIRATEKELLHTSHGVKAILSLPQHFQVDRGIVFNVLVSVV